MSDTERQFHRWLAGRTGEQRRNVLLSVGDDMAALRSPGNLLLVSSDMLLDGVHFDSAQHGLEIIGYKAVACVISDCAAMAVRPLAITLSVAMPRPLDKEKLQRLLDAAINACEVFECSLVGGDTTSWDHPLAIDACVVAVPHPDIIPLKRSGARAGDGLFVTGPLGGSQLGKHLTFVPRVGEAELIARTLGPDLHAMLDISDGLALDLDRMAEASGIGAVLDEGLVLHTASDAARKAAQQDQRELLDHVLSDGEDFELLLAAQVDDRTAHQLHLLRVGEMASGDGLRIRRANGALEPLKPTGYQHQ